MQYLTVKEAAEKLGASTSAIRRRILPIARNAKHEDRGLILPTPSEVEEFDRTRTGFGWKIAEELVGRLTPAASASASKPKAPTGTDGSPLSAIVEVLKQQVMLNQQQLQEKDKQIASLHERIHESNVLIGSLQQQLALPPPAAATDSSKTTASQQSPAPKKSRWWNRVLWD
jgi:hypothetical protein